MFTLQKKIILRHVLMFKHIQIVGDMRCHGALKEPKLIFLVRIVKSMPMTDATMKNVVCQP